MADLTAQALAWMQRHHGLTTRRLLREHGVGRRTIDRLIDAGVLHTHSRFKVVLASATNPRTFEQDCLALCLAHPGGYVTGPTGGKLAGLRRMPSRAPLHLAIRHGHRLDPVEGVRFRQTTRLDQRDVLLRPDGILVARPARLAFDLAADLGRLDLLSVVEQLLHQEHCTMDELVAVAERLAHPRRPGSLRFLRTLQDRGDRPPAESHPELVLAEALRELDVPIEVQTTWLDLPGGRRIRMDLSVPAIRWGVEIDIHPEHLGLLGSTRDKQRDRLCHLVGWQVERVTEVDFRDVPRLARELRDLYLARRGQFSAA